MKTCPSCKLFNAPTAQRCDCGYRFPVDTIRTAQESPGLEHAVELSPTPAMSTINGWGTWFWGWRHQADGTATVTRWFVAFWFPVVPLSRHRIRVLSDFAHPDPEQRPATSHGQTTVYQYLATLPLSMREIGLTLLRAYVGVPLILIGPLLLLAGLVVVAGKLGPNLRDSGDTVPTIFAVLACLTLVNFVWQCLLALRAGRGWHPDLLAKLDPFRWCFRRLSSNRSPAKA